MYNFITQAKHKHPPSRISTNVWCTTKAEVVPWLILVVHHKWLDIDQIYSHLNTLKMSVIQFLVTFWNDDIVKPNIFFIITNCFVTASLKWINSQQFLATTILDLLFLIGSLYIQISKISHSGSSKILILESNCREPNWSASN